jgi:ANTAR domain-containing protein/GAF domain-containing protein
MRNLEDTLAAIATSACAAIDWVDAAGICVADGSGLVTLGATDPLVHKAEAAQGELREGPSLSVAPAVPLVHSSDVVHDPRWPRYALAAAELGIAAQTGAFVPASHSQVAVLNLYSRSGRRLDPSSARLAGLLADQAATAMEVASRVETLTEAVGARHDISQAIGIAMERFGLNEGRAFDYLARVSQTSQVKLRVIARELVAQANVRDAEQ